MGPEVTDSSLILHTPDKGEHYTVPFTPGVSVALKVIPVDFNRSDQNLILYMGDDASITLENFFTHGIRNPPIIFILPDLVEIEAATLFERLVPDYEYNIIGCKNLLPYTPSSGLNSYMALAGRLINGVDALSIPDDAGQEPSTVPTSLQTAFLSGNFNLADEWEGFTPADASLIISPPGIDYHNASPHNAPPQNVSYAETVYPQPDGVDNPQLVAFANSAAPRLALILYEGAGNDFTGLYAETLFADAAEQRLQFAAGQELFITPGNQPESFEALHLDLDESAPLDIDIDAVLASLADLPNGASRKGNSANTYSVHTASNMAGSPDAPDAAGLPGVHDAPNTFAPSASPGEAGLARPVTETLNNGKDEGGDENELYSLPQYAFEPHMLNDPGIQAVTLHVYLQIAS